MNFMPHYDVDQYIYWHEMATYAQVGFHGGYYGVNELLSPIKGFGPHGIGIIMVYGALYSLMPWLGFAAIPVINVALLTLALQGYVWFLRPKLGEAILVCLVVALYPPLFFYLPTSFQEGFHYAAAVVLALIFIRLVRQRNEPLQLKFQLFSGIFLLLLCFVRYTWAVCFVPYFYIVLSGRRWRLPSAFILTFLFSILIVWGFTLFVPAWYSSPESGVHVFGQSLNDRIGFFLERAYDNLRSLFDYENNRAAAAVLSGMVIFSIVGGVIALRQASWKRLETSSGTVVFLLILLNMLGLLGVFIVAWTGSGRHLVRLLSANYLFCFIVAFHFFPWRTFHVLVVYNTMLLPLYLGIFQVYHLPGYINKESRLKVQKFMQQTAPHLSLPAGAHPWDKTIFVDIPERGLAYLGIPPEFGIQTTTGKINVLPRLSRFALLSSPPTYVEGQKWIPLVETAIGTLYIRFTTGKDSLMLGKGDIR